MKKIITFLGALFMAGCSHQETQSTNTLQSKDSAVQAAKVPAQQSNNTISYKTYCNSRYGFCIDYPENILYPQGESGSGDGQVFQSKDGANTLRVYRDLRDNMDPDTKFTIETAYNEDINLGSTNYLERITYKKLGKDFYVLSGYHETKVFYKKTMVSDSQLVTCVLEYKAADKELYDQISEHVSKSLK